MTEYDFSPEAYQAHLDNMSRISRWVDRTEEHRGEYTNAAALIDPNGPPPAPPSSSPPTELRSSFGSRRKKVPTPLALHPFGTPDPFYAAMQSGVGMSPYASPMHSGVVYANGLGSPGPMPSPMYGHPGYPMPRSAGVQMMVMPPPLMSPPLVSPPPSPPHYQAHHHHRHSRRSRANSFSLSLAPPAPPYAGDPMMSMGMAPPTPTYVIMPPTTSRHHRDRHRSRPEVQFVVSVQSLMPKA
ncbi:hypothetical protein H0H92_011296 [Tricholoma furcatifolium]|nr:hypothetical protein H0H92_011296 [Tricholoma furcatifolium]